MACSRCFRTNEVFPPVPRTNDPSSFSNVTEMRTNHLHLDLTVDFAQTLLRGAVTLDVEVVGTEASSLVLDTRALTISRVCTVEAADECGKELAFAVSADVSESFGAALTILFGETLVQGAKKQVRIEYTTSPTASGLQWLPPAQTEGKQHPYVFTQFQAIHARSGLPCQDTPSVKASYSAAIHVPAPLTALMSALSTSSAAQADGCTTFNFQQDVPIPSYLIALVVGHLESRELGPRSRVWSEPSMVEAGAYEFADTESFLAAAEKYLTPYCWGRYDLLLLPSSFPYGGMENPMLTFVTPTLLAGDRSLANVVAHEIAHSWMGNLLTTSTWEHFWCNEGFTVFVERKIIAAISGKPVAELDAILGDGALKTTVDRLMTHAPQFTGLVLPLNGTDPDDAYSSVAYERGFQFLRYIESLIGESEMQQLLQSWVSTHAYKTVSTQLFRDFVTATVQPAERLAAVDWDAWLYGTGATPVTPVFDQTLSLAATSLAAEWLAAAAATASAGGVALPTRSVAGFTAKQVLVFLDELFAKGSLPVPLLQQLDAAYHFSASKNCEILFSFYRCAIASKHEALYEDVIKFVTRVGRMKFVRPLYRMLNEAGPKGAELAKAAFATHASYYNPIASKMIARDLAGVPGSD